jgi:hypothetical protein
MRVRTEVANLRGAGVSDSDSNAADGPLGHLLFNGNFSA